MSGEYWTYFPRLCDTYGPIESFEEAVAEAGTYGLVIGPLSAQEVIVSHKQDAALVAHYLRSLERPTKRLSAWELAFVGKVSDEYRGTGRLPEKTYGLLERLAVEKADV